MKYYSVMFNSPTNTDWIHDYIKPATDAVERYGGKILSRTATHEVLEGDDRAEFRTIIEWPSKDAAKKFMNDAEYLPHLKARLSGSISQHFLIAAKDDMS